MPKKTRVFSCKVCGHTESRWVGRCPRCSEWNSFEEQSETRIKGQSASGSPVLKLKDVPEKETARLQSGNPEIDRVLGGGFLPGSSVLIGGEPGIGKSTLTLQLGTAQKKSLYISGEESRRQIKSRAERLGCSDSEMQLLCESSFERITAVLEQEKPDFIVIDSVQTLCSSDLGPVPGTVSQLKYCCQELISRARREHAVLILIAHVTKGGEIAGPKVIEHMVDTVLYFDHSSTDLRLLKAVKNRFGSTDETGIFLMNEKGLLPVQDPGTFFLEKRSGAGPVGVSVGAVYEGSRILMVEIQVLTIPAKGSFSRIFSDKIDNNRISRIAAVMEKNLNLCFSNQDIYVNVAGGIRLSEVGIELPLALGLYSARTGLPLPAFSASSGEITLSGEIRGIRRTAGRFKTARELGFRRFTGPPSPDLRNLSSEKEGFLTVKTLSEAVEPILKSAPPSPHDSSPHDSSPHGSSLRASSPEASSS